MYGKDKFSRIKDSICNTPVEVDSVCKALLRAADRNGWLVKLERQMKTEVKCYLNQIYHVLNYANNSNGFN